jgi:outer membrane protein OmpA-like peptidoglycan-associated protein
MTMFSRFLVAVPVVALMAGGTACATKGYVRNSVGEVNDKVDSLGRSVEETQERARQSDARIGEVDAATKAAAQSAQQANNAATEAANAARAAGTRADEVGSKAEALDKSSRKLVYEVVLSEDQGKFAFGKVDLPDEAKARLDELITELTADPQAAWFEIEGHTDNVGPKEVNDRIGLERAEAVKRYLYEQHKIPLHKMNVISYGPDKPVAPNNTRDGRSQNRRVVIKIVA